MLKKIENLDDSAVKDFVSTGRIAMAVSLCREIHECTMSEAIKCIDSMREEDG